MTERETIAERLKELAETRSHQYIWGGIRVTADYFELEAVSVAETEADATAAALLALADKLLKVRDHVALMLMPEIDPTKRQVLPRVEL